MIRRWDSYCLLALASLFAAPALAQDAPNPSEVWLQGVSYGGTGCPQNSVATNLSPDAKAVSLIFDQFAVDTTGNRNKKNCRVNLQLHVPAGWTYTLFSVDYRGYADMDEDSEARLRSWYAVGGQSIRIANLKMEGPLQRDYHQRAWVPLDTLPWLQCNNSSSLVSIDTELMVDGPNALLTVDSVDGEIRHDYGIAWRRCSNSSTWAGQCQVVLETVWGSDMNRFTGNGIGINHTEAKGRAEQQARAQCEAERSRIARPLIRATTRCVTDAPYCTARPQ